MGVCSDSVDDVTVCIDLISLPYVARSAGIDPPIRLPQVATGGHMTGVSRSGRPVQPGRFSAWLRVHPAIKVFKSYVWHGFWQPDEHRGAFHGRRS